MAEKPIRFSEYARVKFDVLASHGMPLDQALIEAIVRSPTKTDRGYAGRTIAQGDLDRSRVLRVVYEDERNEIVIVTFYPGRRERYDKDQIQQGG